jgi:hypothetical protein
MEGVIHFELSVNIYHDSIEHATNVRCFSYQQNPNIGHTFLYIYTCLFNRHTLEKTEGEIKNEQPTDTERRQTKQKTQYRKLRC